MINQKDPVSQIKKAEESAEHKIEQARKKLDEDLKKFSEELNKKTVEFEESLRKKGQEKLENVKKEASELFKSRMATSESQKNKLTSEAKERQKEAVSEVANSFLGHIKA